MTRRTQRNHSSAFEAEVARAILKRCVDVLFVDVYPRLDAALKRKGLCEARP